VVYLNFYLALSKIKLSLFYQLFFNLGRSDAGNPESLPYSHLDY